MVQRLQQGADHAQHARRRRRHRQGPEARRVHRRLLRPFQGMIDQGWERYTPEEHRTWRTLFERQTKLLPARACDAFVDGMKRLPIGAEQIPDFRRLSEVLMRATGWQVVAVPGLVPDEVFFDHLANRRFPAG